LFGYSRQVYYRRIRQKQRKQSLASKVVALVTSQRTIMPRIGTRKLYYLLYQELRAMKIGRDKFFAILKANHLLIKPKRSYQVTTWSHHRFRKHPNLIKEMEINQSEQVWVADITYIGKRDKPCYLSLITDAYSKVIVGYNVSDSLSTIGTLRALKMAYKSRTSSNTIIHHSDRGVQYCSDEYQHQLHKYKVKCSMTEQSDPYENAIAERVNGILKQEFMIDTYHLDLKIMKEIVKEAVRIYNTKRPHWSNDLWTPEQMHQQNERKIKSYKIKSGSKLLLTTT
jgi:putative transposase